MMSNSVTIDTQRSSRRYFLAAVAAKQREQWDAFIATQPTGHLLQSWSWGELKTSASWHPLRLALWDISQETIVAAAQVLRRTAPPVPVWAAHLAYIPRGPVMEWSHPVIPRIFLTQLNAYLSEHHALAVQMEPGELLLPGRPQGSPLPTTENTPSERVPESSHQGENALVSQILTSLDFHTVHAIQPIRTILLDLTQDEQTLLARMKEKWRYNLRLAARKGVKVRKAETEEDLLSWYRLLQTTSQRDQFAIHPLDYYLRAWRLLAPRNQGSLFLAEYDEQLLAGIFTSLFAKQAIYLYGASSNEHRSLMPNYLLQWEAIRWAKQEGATRYDFWGIAETDNENEALAGVSRFKSGWGGEVVRFPGNYERIYRPLAMRIARRYLP